MYNAEKRRIVSGGSWRQTYVDNGVGEDREKGGSTSWSTTWRTCGSSWRTWRIKPSGDGEPMWLTPHPRDLNQPEGERESRHDSWRRDVKWMWHRNNNHPSFRQSLSVLLGKMLRGRPIQYTERLPQAPFLLLIWWHGGQQKTSASSEITRTDRLSL